jgi:hypothetical protein
MGSKFHEREGVVVEAEDQTLSGDNASGNA